MPALVLKLWVGHCTQLTLVFLSPFTRSLLISVLSFPRPFLYLPPVFCFFVFVFLTCEFTAVLPSCTALFIPAFSINITQITAMIQTSHQSKHVQWRPQPQTNKDRFITGNINLYFNTCKLKSIYWQTVSYNMICSCLKFSFLSLLIMSKTNWFHRQPAASNVNMINVPPFSTVLSSSVCSIVHNEHIGAQAHVSNYFITLLVYVK